MRKEDCRAGSIRGEGRHRRRVAGLCSAVRGRVPLKCLAATESLGPVGAKIKAAATTIVDVRNVSIGTSRKEMRGDALLEPGAVAVFSPLSVGIPKARHGPPDSDGYPDTVQYSFSSAHLH